MSTTSDKTPPGSSASTSAKGSHLPIPRPSGPSYDKPERARTSHACEPCRERKTKCDGERPACRRCLHTGTSCHYGYGKGWRKRKTAEDLTTTSRRLQRYEALLTEIMPMVPPSVKSMIEEAREQVCAHPARRSQYADLSKESALSNSNGSETTESSEQLHLTSTMNSERSTSSSTSRVSLPLPVPSPLIAQGNRMSLVRPFDSVSPASAANPVPRPTSQRGSPDAASATRLPSIRPDGLLIEPLSSAGPPRMPQTMSEDSALARDRGGIGSTSPHSQASHGEILKQHSAPG